MMASYFMEADSDNKPMFIPSEEPAAHTEEDDPAEFQEAPAYDDQ